MPVFSVIRVADSIEMTRYAAAAQQQFPEYPAPLYTQVEFADDAEVILDPPGVWHIGVGPFWDRFGPYKIPILASSDPVVQAIIRDSSVRKFIDLKGRRSDLVAAISVLQAKGFPLSLTAILDVRPNATEIFNG